MKSVSRSSLRGLRTFCVAAHYQSFRAAAEVLFVTSSAISHQVKTLEQELGLRLFERGTRELKLTSAGTALFEELEPLIESLDECVARHKKTGSRTAVRVSVQPFFASEVFVPRLREFTAQHPDIDIQVGTSDESEEKHPAEADLSIRLFRSPPDGLHADLLFPLRMVPAGSPAFKKGLRVRKGAIESDFPLIIHESRAKGWKDWSAMSGIVLPEDSKTTRLDSMIAVVRAAEQGIGAALVPVPIANLWFQQGSIVRLFEHELVATVSYYLVCRKADLALPGVAELRDWILAEFAEQ